MSKSLKKNIILSRNEAHSILRSKFSVNAWNQVWINSLLCLVIHLDSTIYLVGNSCRNYLLLNNI
jgi:hypothetical protein